MSAGRYLAVIAMATGGIETIPHVAPLGLVERFAGARVRVFTDPGVVCRPCGDAGIVVGPCHGRDATAGSVDGTVCRDDAGSRDFVARHWGDYVAVCEGDAEDIRIIRAPSGGLAAFTASNRGRLWVASDVTLLIALGIVAPTIDWTFVAHHLSFPHLRGALTGIAGVEEILAGEALVVNRAGISRETLWSPWLFVAAEMRFETIETAAAALFAAVTDSVAVMMRSYRSPLLELSGGLDSSVVAAALAYAGIAAKAINLSTPGPEGDERRYAGLVAARTGLDLSEARMDAMLDLTAPFHARTARPGIPAMLRGVEDHFMALARAGGIDAFVSGTGGDSVFCSLGSSAPAADAFRVFGPGRTFVNTVRAVAAVHGANVWSVGRMAVRQALRRSPPAPWPRTTAFLCAGALPNRPLSHPWLVEPQGALPGSRRHIRSIMAAQAHLDGYARHAVAPSLFPLLSQPVIETCLRIPTWMWVAGGRDRAIARRAFRSALPHEVVDRRGKGAMDAYCADVFAHNRVRLRSFLVDGHLAAAGLLDCERLDRYLRQTGPVRDSDFYFVLPIADTEAWVRAWLDGRAATEADSAS